MSKATPLAELQELHQLVAKSLNQRITMDMEDNIPTDAATLGAAIKFLKDNAVTADPSDSDDLSDLRKNLTEQAVSSAFGMMNYLLSLSQHYNLPKSS